MLKCTVENFRGIRRAEIICDRIALLTGPNEQGKSSIIDALRAVLDNTPQPYGLKKDELGLMIHDGHEVASALIESDGRMMRSRWPSADVETAGAPFRATKFATGTLQLSDMEERDRLKALSQYLKTDPSKDELAKAMAILGYKEQAVVELLWTEIQKRGWDGALETQRAATTKLKGGWEQITKGRYGTKVGGTWRPNGWGPEHEALTDETLKTELVAAEKELEGAIGKVAINEDERKRLDGLVRTIPKLEEAVKTRTADGLRAKATKEKAEQEIRNIPVLPDDHWPECPHCKKPIQILGKDRLQAAPKPLTEAEAKKIKDRVADAEGVLRQANEEYDLVTASWTAANNDLKKAKDAKSALENSDPQAIGPEQIDEMRGEVQRIKSILGAKEKIRNAIAAHIEVTKSLEIVDILQPEGLRAVKLKQRLAAFNEKLAELCGIANWSVVSLTPDCQIKINGKPYQLASGSGRARCDLTLQVAFSMMDGSEIMLIDEADIFDGKGRNGLFCLVEHTGLYAIVGMMLVRAKEAPDLRAAEAGRVYWVNEAEAQEMGSAKAAA